MLAAASGLRRAARAGFSDPDRNARLVADTDLLDEALTIERSLGRLGAATLDEVYQTIFDMRGALLVAEVP